MRKIKVNEVPAYCVAFDVYLLILDVLYDIEDKVQIAYVYENAILGNITYKKVYYTNRGAYIIYFGRRIYISEFMQVDFYGTEFRRSHK